MSTLPTIENVLRDAGFPEGWIQHQLGLQAERDALLAENNRLREALRVIESCLAPEDNDFAARTVRAALAEGKGEK